MATRRGVLLLGLVALATVLATSLAAAPRATATEIVVVVQPGDTLSDIAARYGTTPAAIARLNRIPNPDAIRPGQRIRVATRPGAPGAAGERRHVVRHGETLTAIAAKFGTTVAAIAATNHLADPSYVWAGRVLMIPSPARNPARVGTHLVAPGETLTGIAARYATTIAVLAAMNDVADPSYIQAGAVLTVPLPGPTSGSRLPASLAAIMATRTYVRGIIESEARRAGVASSLALAVAWQESGWRQQVVSAAGARGVMQLLPTTATWIGDTMLGRPVDLGSTRDNVRAGVVLLRHYMARYRGDTRLALAAYYQGQRSADSYGVLPISESYVASILGLQRLLP